MLNYLKMDLYRLLRTRSTYIILVLIVAVSVFSGVAIKIEQQMAKDMSREMFEQMEDMQNAEGVGAIGVQVPMDVEWLKETSAISYAKFNMNSFTGRIYIIFLLVFTVNFTMAERKNGYIKNLVGKPHFKEKLMISKWLVACIYAVVIFAVASIANFIGLKLILKNPLDLTFTAEAVKILAIQYILHIALAGFVVLLVGIFESTSISIFASMLVVLNVAALLYSAISYGVKKVFSLDSFDLTNYLPSGCLARTGMGVGSEIMQRGLIVGLTAIVAFMAITCVVVARKDVK